MFLCIYVLDLIYCALEQTWNKLYASLKVMLKVSFANLCLNCLQAEHIDNILNLFKIETTLLEVRNTSLVNQTWLHIRKPCDV